MNKPEHVQPIVGTITTMFRDLELSYVDIMVIISELQHDLLTNIEQTYGGGASGRGKAIEVLDRLYNVTKDNLIDSRKT